MSFAERVRVTYSHSALCSISNDGTFVHFFVVFVWVGISEAVPLRVPHMRPLPSAPEPHWGLFKSLPPPLQHNFSLVFQPSPLALSHNLIIDTFKALKISSITTLPRVQTQVAVLIMPLTSVDDSSSEAEILPFPTLPLLRGYIDDVRTSFNNPTLQKAQIDFLIMNIVAVLDALGSADDTIDALTRELEFLKRAHSRLEVRCDQTHDNNSWLSQRYGEAQISNAELVEANKKLNSELSAASTKEKQLLERVTCMELAIRRLSALIITKRVGPYKAIESWVINSIPPLNQVTEGCESDYFAEPCLQDRGKVVEVGGGHVMAAVNSIGPGRNAVTQ